MEGMNNKTTVESTLNCLSRYLKEEIIKEVYLKSLANIPILKNNFSSAFLEKLSLRMTESHYSNTLN